MFKQCVSDILLTLFSEQNISDVTDWFQIGKGVRQGYIYCHPAYLTYMQSAS